MRLERGRLAPLSAGTQRRPFRYFLTSPEIIRLAVMTYVQRERGGGLRSSLWRSHIDEVFVKVSGMKHYLLRGGIHEVELLEVLTFKQRDMAAALKSVYKFM